MANDEFQDFTTSTPWERQMLLLPVLTLLRDSVCQKLCQKHPMSSGCVARLLCEAISKHADTQACGIY